MATTSVVFVVFIAQGIWCLPLELGLSSAGGGGQSGSYQVTDGVGAINPMDLIGRIFMANQGGLQSGSSLGSRVMNIPASTLSYLASGVQPSNSGSEYSTQGGNTGIASFNVNTPGMLKTMGDMAGTVLNLPDKGVQIGTEGLNTGVGLVGQTSSAITDTMKGLINGGRISNVFTEPNSHSVTRSINYKSGASESGNGLNVNVPSKGVINTMGDMAGLVDQGIQMGVNAEKMKTDMIGQTSSTVTNIVKDLIGNNKVGVSSSYKEPGTSSSTSTYNFHSVGNSNSGSTGNSGRSSNGDSSKYEYSYGLNMPREMMSTARDMAGPAIGLFDDGVQLGTRSAQLIPEMTGEASSAIRHILKDVIGNTGIDTSSSSNVPSTHSVTSSYNYKSDDNSKGGVTGNLGRSLHDDSSKYEYSYGVNVPSTGMMSTVKDMFGSGMGIANHVVQLGTKGAQIMPEIASHTSSAITDTMNGMIGRTGVSSSSKEPSAHSVTSYNYQSGGSTGNSGGSSLGDSSKFEYSHGLNIPEGMMSTVTDMVGSAISTANGGVQLGTRAAQVMPEMASHTSSVITDTMNGMIGRTGVSSSSTEPSTHSVISSYNYQSGGNLRGGSKDNSGGSFSHGDSFNHENSYGINIPSTGMMSAVRNMAGSAEGMADQSVQMGVRATNSIPNIIGRMSSSVSNNLKGIIGDTENGGGSSSSVLSHDVKGEIDENSS